MQNIDNKGIELPPPPDNKIIKTAARKFANDWAKHRGDEKQESQQFWTSMLTDVFGIKHAYEYIHFEEKVGRKFIDAFIDIPGAGVYIEHKSSDVDLDTKQRQSDGSMLTPDSLP